LAELAEDVLGVLSLGSVAVVVVGAGMGAFGLYLMARSRHLDDDSFAG
jgi:hypothetical protein